MIVVPNIARGFVPALLVAACSGGGEDNRAAPADDAAALAARYFAEAGADYQACFVDLPQMRDAGADGNYAAAGDRSPDGTGIVMAIDASGSMAGRIGAATKMEAAKDAARQFLNRAPEGAPVGLVAFGHRGDNREASKAASCAAVETLYPAGTADRGRIDAALAGFSPRGWTPLAAAITRSGEELTRAGGSGAPVVYVVSDGEDTCGGDPVAAARRLHDGGTRAIVNVIGLDLAAPDRAQLRAVAAAGGGSFVEMNDSRDVARHVRDEARRITGNVATAARVARSNVADAAYNARVSVAAEAKLGTCTVGAAASDARTSPRWLRENVPDPVLAARVREQIQARTDRYMDRGRREAETIRARATAANDAIETRQRANTDRYEAAR